MAEQSSAFQDRKEGLQFRCEACGGALVYDINKKARNMRCTSCGRTVGIHTVQPLKELADEQTPDTLQTLEYRCPSCGAALYTTQTSATSFCSYCGADVVLTERISHMLRPSMIAPFTVTREECEQIYRQRLSESRFVPEEMASQETISHFRPVYVPFWRYSGSGDGPSKGLYSKTTTVGNVEYTDTYEAELDNRVSISNVLYDASSQFDDETAQALNFRLDNLVPFGPAYLAGMYAEAPDLDPKACYNWLSRTAQRIFNSRLIGQEAHTVACFPSNFKGKAELVLLPVWLLATRQGEKVIYTAVNGNSGAILSDLPVSPKRAGITAGVVTLILTALLVGLHHIILLRPRITAALSCVLAMICWNVIGPFLNRVSQKAQQDDDLTRLMKKNRSSSGDQILNPDDLPDGNEAKPIIRMKWIGIISAVATSVFLIGYVTADNPPLYLDQYISDRAMLPPVLTLISGILEAFMLLQLSEMSSHFRAALIAHIALCGLMWLLGPFIAHSIWFYLLILVNYGLTLAVLIRGFLMHNEYVSRPVPFFGKGDETI